MTRLRLTAAFALLALVSGCIWLPMDANDPARGISASVTVQTTGDSVAVHAVFFPVDGGGRIGYASDTLRVQNVAVRAVPKERNVFAVQLPLDSAARAGGIRVRVPVPRLAPMPVPEFTVFSAARGGPAAIQLRAGQDLVLSVVPGASGTLPAPTFEHWSATVHRGNRSVTVSGTGPPPSPVVVPWAVIPEGASQTLSVNVTSAREFVIPNSGGRTQMTVSAPAFLEWSVRLVP